MSPEKVRSSLLELARMDSESRAERDAIRKAAEYRRGAIERRIAAARRMAYTDRAAAQEYQDLIAERAEIDRLLAQ